MEFELKSHNVTSFEVQQIIDGAWNHACAGGVSVDLRDQLVEYGLLGEEAPFEARPGAEGFGAVELILIAAAGRLAASIPERLLVRVFDEIIWPKLQARFGSGLERDENDQ